MNNSSIFLCEFCDFLQSNFDIAVGKRRDENESYYMLRLMKHFSTKVKEEKELEIFKLKIMSENILNAESGKR